MFLTVKSPSKFLFAAMPSYEYLKIHMIIKQQFLNFSDYLINVIYLLHYILGYTLSKLFVRDAPLIYILKILSK